MTIVVTGASGHVGNNLVRALTRQGRPVRAMIHVDRRALDGLAIEMVKGDILDPASLEKAFDGADMVYHLAGNISLSDMRKMKAVNAVGTRNVVEACLRNRVRRLVHFSSIHAVAYSPAREVIDESCSLVASSDCSDYGRSKAAAEVEVHKALERGLNTVIIRPTAILGPHDYQPSFFGEMMLRLARSKLPALVAGGFDWVDVRDVVDGAIRAGDNAPAGGEYLLSGHWATLGEVAAMVDKVTKCGVLRFSCPVWLAGLGAPLATTFDRVTRRRPLFTSYSIDTIRTSKRVSHAKATLELDYNPRPLQTSIEDTLMWFRQDGRLAATDHGAKTR